MWSFLLYCFSIIVALLLQTLPVFQDLFYGVVPDLLLVIITFIAINFGKTAGGLAGFGAGFLQDLLSGGLFGVNAVSKAITGYLFGFLQSNIYRKKLVVPPLVAFFATIVNQLLVVSFGGYLVSFLPLGTVLGDVVFPLALGNAAGALIIYPILYMLGGSNK